MIRSAAEEAFRSVSAVAGTLARLAYLAELQTAPGVYRHWGLEKDYGEEATHIAFRSAHLLIVETVLQTDFSELLMEIRLNADGENVSATEWFRRILEAPCLDPGKSGEQIYLHFKYVLAALQALVARSV